MKVYDKVRVTRDKESYNADNIYKGDIGTIWFAEIRFNTFAVYFEKPTAKVDFTLCDIDIADLELVEDGESTDNEILEELPTPDPRWWCKVENGYILNLLGEKKNKIPYDYNS